MHAPGLRRASWPAIRLDVRALQAGPFPVVPAYPWAVTVDLAQMRLSVQEDAQAVRTHRHHLSGWVCHELLVIDLCVTEPVNERLFRDGNRSAALAATSPASPCHFGFKNKKRGRSLIALRLRYPRPRQVPARCPHPSCLQPFQRQR